VAFYKFIHNCECNITKASTFKITTAFTMVKSHPKYRREDITTQFAIAFCDGNHHWDCNDLRS
jgi:hypothetical protein